MHYGALHLQNRRSSKVSNSKDKVVVDWMIYYFRDAYELDLRIGECSKNLHNHNQEIHRSLN